MSLRKPALFVLAALLSAVPACDDEPPMTLPDPCDRIGDPDFTGPGYGVIGPEGGVVEQTDPASRIFGVKVEVPPGAWDDCWEVALYYETIFGTPNYPDGYEPFERPDASGAVEVDIGLSTLGGFYRSPDPLPIELSFPMSAIEPEPIEARAAYFYDDAAESWRLVLPGALTPDRLWISSDTHEPLWSWGLINLNDIDFEEHVEPAIEDHYGTETWAEIQAAVDEAYRRALEEQDLRMCAGLDIGEQILIGLRDDAERQALELQMSLDCGECNAVSTEFYEGIADYIRLNLQAMLTELFIDIVPNKLVFFPFKLAGYGMLLAVEAMIEALPCDYECFFTSVNPAIFVNVAMYYGSEATIELINWYRNSEYITCPPESATEILLAPPG